MDAVVHITGYAGTEIDTRANGTVAKFRLACTPRVKSKGEWQNGGTTWLEVVCFRSLAAHVQASVRKGDAVVVVGRLRTNVWERDGAAHEKLVLEAEVVGHDLNRGTAAFRKQVRSIFPEPAGQEPPQDESDEAGLPKEEREAREELAA